MLQDQFFAAWNLSVKLGKTLCGARDIAKRKLRQVRRNFLNSLQKEIDLFLFALFLAEADGLGKLPALFRIIGCNHRIIVW